MNTAEKIAHLTANIASVFIGKPHAVRQVIATLLAGGHVLIEDVPGIGKTLLGIALARSIDASFMRIQFTNDLLPSDILGVTTFHPEKQAFEFRRGPIFSNIVLADEINRATPKTQSSLLEAMNDRQITVDGVTHHLSPPFMVIATQNPVEYHGTFPLPEAQLDRFFMRVRIGYPTLEDEKAIVQDHHLYARAGELPAALTHEEVMDLQEETERVRLDEMLLEYIIRIADATRQDPRIQLGISPRGALFLHRAAQAAAIMDGRDACTPDDIKSMAVPVFSHRLIVESNLYGMARIDESERIMNEILERTPVPL